MLVAQILLALALIGTISSTIYLILAILAAARYRAATVRERSSPPLSVLKPMHGLEPGLEQNLISFFEQDYCEFELIFCARELSDPALELARTLARRYPAVSVKIIASGEPLWPNPRTYSVDAMLSHASHDTLVVTDSDVRVDKDFLDRAVRPIVDPSVGLVTCLYRGVPTGGLWARLEALGMSVELMAGVLVANMMEGMKFALGPATVTRKDCIERIGGLAESGQFHADDFALGSLISQSGMKVVLSDYVVEHVAPECSLAMFMRHQLLWARNGRYLRPWGHLGTGLTFATPYALLGLCVAGALGHWEIALGWLAWGVINRVVQCVAIGWGVVRDREAISKCWLYPVRDFLGFVIWASSYFSSRIHFRGEEYRLLRGGKIKRHHGPA